MRALVSSSSLDRKLLSESDSIAVASEEWALLAYSYENGVEKLFFVIHMQYHVFLETIKGNDQSLHQIYSI